MSEPHTHSFDNSRLQSLSYWEQSHFVHYDFVVIGGGICGLSTAASLAEQQPGARMLVIERGLLPSGASTKNAGFACFGSLTELLADWETMGQEAALQLVQERWQGLQKLRDRLGDHAISYQSVGGYELISEELLPAVERLREVNSWLHPLFGQEVFTRQNSKMTHFGFGTQHWGEMIYNPFEGHIDTGKMMWSLQRYVQERGVTLMTGATVCALEEGASGVQLTIEGTMGHLQIQADQVAVCTNAFTKQLLPDMELEPGRGLVMVTKPLRAVPFRGTFHFDQGYFYFRDAGDRVLFGGGRNKAYEQEHTDAFGVNEELLGLLTCYLSEAILPNQPWELDMAWSGIMAFGPDKQPLLRQISDRVVAGVRLGGMGVAIGSRLGEKLAQVML